MALDLRLSGRGFDSQPVLRFQVATLGKLFTHKYLCTTSSTVWYRVLVYRWKGNRRSGVAVAMRHRLRWFIHLRVHGLRKGDEHPAYTPRGV